MSWNKVDMQEERKGGMGASPLPSNSHPPPERSVNDVMRTICQPCPETEHLEAHATSGVFGIEENAGLFSEESGSMNAAFIYIPP